MSVEVKFHWAQALVVVAVMGVGAALLTGCSNENLAGLDNPSRVIDGGAAADRAGSGVVMSGHTAPAGLTQIEVNGETLTLWPYTGRDFSGTPVDPVNLVFVGEADPAEIRNALLQLDGDRTALGYPPAFPFNATWTEAIGDVQTNHAGNEGWLGNVIQLQLGSYESVRFHLRLFRTGEAFGRGGEWTVGAAHFEVLIPGTADHQVLSWEHAEQIVTADLVRSGILGAPPAPTAVINETGSFREIPAFIYNELPVELKMFIGGPLGNVDAPVGIPTDGYATVLNLVGTAPAVIGPRVQHFTLVYDQVIPKPFCSDGPADWVYISGPVNLDQTVETGANGNYQYHSRISGTLTATPVDISQNPPLPVGESFQAEVGDKQHGFLKDGHARVDFQTKRVAPQDDGTEMNMTHLKVATRGEKTYREKAMCLE
jgi:hypothetical protein